MFNKNKSRIDIKEYLKDMKVSQSAMISRSSSQQSGPRNSQELYTTHASQGHRKQCRTIINYDDREMKQLFSSPPTQNMSDSGNYSQGRNRTPQMERSSSPPPLKQDNSYNYYSEQKSNKQQNYYQNPTLASNQPVPYSYPHPYYQYNSQHQEINQINSKIPMEQQQRVQGKLQYQQSIQNIQQNPNQYPPFYWYLPQFTPPTQKQDTKKTITKQQEIKVDKIIQKQKNKQLKKQIKRNSSQRKQLSGSKKKVNKTNNIINTDSQQLLDQLKQFNSSVKQFSQDKFSPLTIDYTSKFQKDFMTGIISNNIKNMDKILDPLNEIAKQMKLLQKSSNKTRQIFADLSKNLQLLQKQFVNRYDEEDIDDYCSEISESEDQD